MRRTFAALLAVTVLTVPAPSATASPGLAWGKCPELSGNDPRLVCATLRVPLDYRDPRGRTIEIMISKIPAAKPGSRRGVLLHNPGGPGGPGLDLPVWYARHYPAEVLDRYDLIGFDPRGVGHSTPVHCGRTSGEFPADLEAGFPAADGSIDRNIKFAKEVARDCLHHGGNILPHITTANTARDMDRIRIALAEQKISYHGGSYGTYLGAVYATMFADRTGRFILDSNVDPNRAWHEQWKLWDHGFEVRFAEIAAWIAERHEEYRLGTTTAEVRAKYLEVTAKLDVNPMRLPGSDHLITGPGLRADLRAMSAHSRSFPAIAEWLVLADRGEGGAPSRKEDVPFDNFFAALQAVTCGDASSSRDIEHYRREVVLHRKLFPLSDGMGANIRPCAFWPDPIEPPVKVTGKGPANILMLQTLRDPATPYVGALGMRRALGQRAKMVTVNGGNHAAYSTIYPCAMDEAHRFLTTGALPSRDVFCG